MLMYPILVKIGGFPIYTHGIFIAVGLLTGLMVLKRDATRENLDQEKILDFTFWILLAALFGSRFIFIVTRPIEYLSNPIEIFNIRDGGFLFYGGFFGAWVVGFIYLKKNRLHFWKIADIITIPLAISLFFGRLGCFFVGCCYGRITDMPWAVRFNHPDSIAPIGIPLHPTQIYLAFVNLFILGVLLIIRKYQKNSGQLFWMYVFLYGSIHSVVEWFRGDKMSPIIFNYYSLNHFIALLMAFSAAIIILYYLIFNEEKKDVQDYNQ